MARASKQGDFNATPLAATTLAAGLPLLPDLCARGCCVSGRSRASLALGNCAVQAGCRVIGGSEEALHTLLARIAARGRALGATSQRARSAVAVGIDIVALEEQGEEGARLKPPNSLSDSLTHIPPHPGACLQKILQLPHLLAHGAGAGGIARLAVGHGAQLAALQRVQIVALLACLAAGVVQLGP